MCGTGFGTGKSGNQKRRSLFSAILPLPAFFCRICGMSRPFVLWHSLVLAPTSVSEIVTEEREKGCVYFRATKLGDQSHLFIAGEAPSFAARFCEVFSDKGHRH